MGECFSTRNAAKQNAKTPISVAMTLAMVLYLPACGSGTGDSQDAGEDVTGDTAVDTHEDPGPDPGAEPGPDGTETTDAPDTPEGAGDADLDAGEDAQPDGPADPCLDYIDCWMEYRECVDAGGYPECGSCLPGYHDEGGECAADGPAPEDRIFVDDFVEAWKHDPPVTLGEWDVDVTLSTDETFEGTHALEVSYSTSGYAMIGIYLSSGPGDGDTTPVSFTTANKKVVLHAYSPDTPINDFYLTGIAESGLMESNMVPFGELDQEAAGAWTRLSYDLEEFDTELIGFGVRAMGPALLYLDYVYIGGPCVPGTVQLCGTNVGECHIGLSTCTGDETWGDCYGDRGPADEACDGLDNDCDEEEDGEAATLWCRVTMADPGLVCEDGSCIACTPDCPPDADPCDADGCGGTCGDCDAVAYRDFGKGNPWDAAEAVRLVPPAETVCDNCWYIFTRAQETCRLGNAEDEEYCAFWETYDRTGGTVNDVFEYIARPEAFEVDSWGVKLRKYGRFNITAAPFSGFEDRTLYLTVRYKDVVLPGSYGDGASVYIRNGEAWMRLGGLGGDMDFTWKTAQLAVEAGRRAPEAGWFELAVGRYNNEYSDEMLGEIQIDQVRLALDEERFPESLSDPTPGAGADPIPSQFDTIGRDAVFGTDPLDEPFFPYGAFHIQADFTGELAGQMTAAHMNTVVSIQWTQPIEDHIHDYASVASACGMKAFVTMIGEFWPWAVASSTQANFTRYEGSMHNVLEHHRDVIESYVSGPNAELHDAVLLWGSKDEVDHDDINGANGGAPPLSFLQNYALMVRQTDPDRPHAQLTMGWHGPGEFSVFGGIGDVLTEDHYINTESVPEDDLGARIARTRETGARIDDMREGRDPNANLILAVPQGMYTSSDRLSTQDIVAQSYQAITHGAQGIIFFKFIEAAAYGPEYAGMVQVGEELFGESGLAPLLLDPDAAIDIMGESGFVTVIGDPDGKISHIYMTDGEHRYLITVMIGTDASDYDGDLDVTFQLSDMAGMSATVDVMFEGRSVDMADGLIAGSFSGFGSRHVYRF